MRFFDSAFLFLFVALIAVASCFGPTVEANDDAEQRFALMVAATATNEAGMRSPRDVGLVYQAASYHGRTNVDRLRWLSRHSARVNGDRECAPGRNCRWTRNLRWNNERPEGYPIGARWVPEDWARQRAFALRVVRGELPPVCPVPVITWGNRADFDANRYGLIAIDCGARNLGGTTAGILRRRSVALSFNVR